MEYVDILLATYNGEKYIKELLESILNQTYKNIRILICDDYSSDKTTNPFFSPLPSLEKKFTSMRTLFTFADGGKTLLNCNYNSGRADGWISFATFAAHQHN